jgi:hypothetical protein
MSYKERIIEYINKHPEGVDDDTISNALQIFPRQTVNQMCRKLQREGRIVRSNAYGKIRNFPDKVSAKTVRTHSQDNENLRSLNYNQQIPWSAFEVQARHAMEEKLGIELGSRGLSINGKIKKFDLVNETKRIVGDIKLYRTTSGGNRPSAKFSTLNEYVWLMQLLEKYTGNKWRKLLIIGEDYKMTRQYVMEYDKWLDDTEIYFFSRKSGFEKIR